MFKVERVPASIRTSADPGVSAQPYQAPLEPSSKPPQRWDSGTSIKSAPIDVTDVLDDMDNDIPIGENDTETGPGLGMTLVLLALLYLGRKG